MVKKLWNSGMAGEEIMERIEGTVTTAISDSVKSFV